jgi:hypothetical protein
MAFIYGDVRLARHFPYGIGVFELGQVGRPTSQRDIQAEFGRTRISLANVADLNFASAEEVRCFVRTEFP